MATERSADRPRVAGDIAPPSELQDRLWNMDGHHTMQVLHSQPILFLSGVFVWF